VSARHQVNGWIVFSKETDPAEETGFLRSVRVPCIRNFTGASASREIWS
jgi:hypothetical protein